MIEIGQPAWHEKAQCVIEQTPIDAFYPERAEGFSTRESLARLCIRDCVVREQCLQEALDTHEEFGWRGATSPRERQNIRRLNITAAEYIKGQKDRVYYVPGVGRPNRKIK